MPGIGLVYRMDNDNYNITKNEVFNAFKILSDDDNYQAKILINSDKYVIGESKYNEYPTLIVDYKKYSIIIEGKIYNKSKEIQIKELKWLCEMIFKVNRFNNSEIYDWLNNTDGDFVIIFVDRETHNIVVINDLLGRLPLYSYESDGVYYLSREIRFITKLNDVLDYDKIGIAEFLIFGYSLGERTFIKDIHRVKPASLLKFENNNKVINIQLYDFDYKIKNKQQDIDKNATVLSNLFIDSCKSRTDLSCPSVLSLSGGLDSRAVAAGLKRAEEPFEAATFTLPDNSTSNDEIVAKILSEELKIKWEAYELTLPPEKNYRKLICLKGALNSIYMSFILEFFDKLLVNYGKCISYFTGDGGDKVLPNLHPLRKIKNNQELLNYVINRNSLTDIDKIANLVKINKKHLNKDITDLLLSYPEKDLSYKYIHFIIHERGMKWLFEGEDRNRYYFWSVAPFWGVKVFKYAMSCSHQQKFGNRLYLKFMKQLNKKFAIIEDSNSMLSPISSFYFLKLVVSSLVKRSGYFYKNAKKFLKRKKGYQTDAQNVIQLKKDIVEQDWNRDYISKQVLVEIINNSIDYPKSLIDNIYTLKLFSDQVCHDNVKTTL